MTIMFKKVRRKKAFSWTGSIYIYMIADELARAGDACDALRSDDPLRPKMMTLLDTIKKRLEGSEGASRGRRPTLPDRRQFLTKLLRKLLD